METIIKGDCNLGVRITGHVWTKKSGSFYAHTFIVSTNQTGYQYKRFKTIAGAERWAHKTIAKHAQFFAPPASFAELITTCKTNGYVISALLADKKN